MEKDIYNPIEQRKTKPKIDDILPIYLDNSKVEMAMAFVSFLRENKMSPGWRSPNSWCSSYKGKVVAYIKIADAAYGNKKFDSWQIVFFGHYNYENEGLFDEHNKKIAWSKIRFCECCNNCKHSPGIKATILNKELDANICCYMSLRFNDPDIEELNCEMNLVMTSKKYISAK